MAGAAVNGPPRQQEPLSWESLRRCRWAVSSASDTCRRARAVTHSTPPAATNFVARGPRCLNVDGGSQSEVTAFATLALYVGIVETLGDEADQGDGRGETMH